MSGMETELTTMHRMINSLYEKQKQLESLLSSLPAGDKYAALKKDGEALLKKMKAWDEDMVQRKSKAYDDVENFPNKFTANYLFLINQTESDIPRVNQPSLDRMKELNAQWASLKARGIEIRTKISRRLISDFGMRGWGRSGRSSGLQRQIANVAELAGYVGKEVGVSDWLEVSQERINQFAEATEDRQWIHVDPERAARESPFQSTIAHGFLTLSLLSELAKMTMSIGGVRMGINYGLIVFALSRRYLRVHAYVVGFTWPHFRRSRRGDR